MALGTPDMDKWPCPPHIYILISKATSVYPKRHCIDHYQKAPNALSKN